MFLSIFVLVDIIDVTFTYACYRTQYFEVEGHRGRGGIPSFVIQPPAQLKIFKWLSENWKRFYLLIGLNRVKLNWREGRICWNLTLTLLRIIQLSDIKRYCVMKPYIYISPQVSKPPPLGTYPPKQSILDISTPSSYKSNQALEIDPSQLTILYKNARKKRKNERIPNACMILFSFLPCLGWSRMGWRVCKGMCPDKYEVGVDTIGS